MVTHVNRRSKSARAKSGGVVSDTLSISRGSCEMAGASEGGKRGPVVRTRTESTLIAERQTVSHSGEKGWDNQNY